jgi:hypothetical protein
VYGVSNEEDPDSRNSICVPLDAEARTLFSVRGDGRLQLACDADSRVIIKAAPAEVHHDAKPDTESDTESDAEFGVD